jgi:hypothetical protein
VIHTQVVVVKCRYLCKLSKASYSNYWSKRLRGNPRQRVLAFASSKDSTNCLTGPCSGLNSASIVFHCRVRTLFSRCSSSSRPHLLTRETAGRHRCCTGACARQDRHSPTPNGTVYK